LFFFASRQKEKCIGRKLPENRNVQGKKNALQNIFA